MREPKILAVLLTAAALAAPLAAQLPARSRPVEVSIQTRVDREREYVKIVRVPGPPPASSDLRVDGHRTWWFFARGGFDGRRAVYDRWRARHNSSVLFQPSVVVQPPLVVAPRYLRSW